MEIRALTAAEKPAAQRLAMEVFLNSDGLGFSEQGMHSVFEFIEGEAALVTGVPSVPTESLESSNIESKSSISSAEDWEVSA